MSNEEMWKCFIYWY